MTKKPKHSKERRPKGSKLKTEGIKAAARAEARGLSFTDIISQLMSDFGVSRATAVRWRNDAIKQELASKCDLDTRDLEGIRHGVLYRHKMRQAPIEAEFRRLVDQGTAKSLANSLKFAKMAKDLDESIARMCHLHIIPPDRDLSQPEVLDQTITALLRHVAAIPRDRLRQLSEACARQLQLHQREPDPGDSDEHVEYREEQSTDSLDVEADYLLE